MMLPAEFVDRCGQLAPAHIFDVLMGLCASAREGLQSGPDVIDLAVADGSGHSLGVSVGIQTCLLVRNSEADIVGLVHIGLGSQEGC